MHAASAVPTMNENRKGPEQVNLGIADENVFAGGHIADLYGTDSEFENAFGFVPRSQVAAQ